MKTSALFKLTIAVLIIPMMVFSVALPLQAQESTYSETYDWYSREELAQMLAPIALYPDTLLSQILMASTYPIEMIEADRWLKRNPQLQSDALDYALLDKTWDPSVKALCHFPSILALMSERIGETTDLGNAFLAQEEEVLDMVQELRASARAAGRLSSSDRQRVIVAQETIIIEPAQTRVIYVPYYDPYYVYGGWWYPDYPPYFWGPPGVGFGIGYSYWPGFYFSWTFANWSYFDWRERYVYINTYKRPRYVRHDHWASHHGRWHHAPNHRHGVAYGDRSTARKFGQRTYTHRDVHRDVRSDTRVFTEHDSRTLRSTDQIRTRNVITETTRAPAVSTTDVRTRRSVESVTPDRHDRRFARDTHSPQRVESKRTKLTLSEAREQVKAEVIRRQQGARDDRRPSQVAREQRRQAPAAEVVRQSRQPRKDTVRQVERPGNKLTFSEARERVKAEIIRRQQGAKDNQRPAHVNREQRRQAPAAEVVRQNRQPRKDTVRQVERPVTKLTFSEARKRVKAEVIRRQQGAR